MGTEASDLIAWCQRQREEALGQIELFSSKGVKAMLQMPDGSMQEITAAVLRSQTENAAAMARIVSALEQC